MKPGQIIYQNKIATEQVILIRYPQEGDAQMMCDYINRLSKEQTFIRFQGEQISLEDETKYLNGQLEKIKNQKTVQLFVVCDDKIVGIAAIDLKDKTESHEGVFGISLAMDFRGQGLGKTLMRLTLEEAEKNLHNLHLVTLGVFGDNTHAQDLYKKFGFQEYGRLPGGSQHKSQYVDHIYLYKKIKNRDKSCIDKLAFIELKDRKLLVTLSRGKDTWYIPGGKRDGNETDHQALIREVKEELTVELIPETITYCGTFEAQAHGKPAGTIVRMTCYVAKFVGELKASSEVVAYRYVNYSWKENCSPVDMLIFDNLFAKGLVQ